jgi:enterochelin esterase-like enzyme
MIHRIVGALFGAVVLSVATALPAAAQTSEPPAAAPPRVAFTFPPVKPNGPMAPADHIAVHGYSLEGNLEGDSPDRAVEVILPPSYATDRRRRYPVIYLLHGFAISGQYFADFIHAREAVLKSAEKGVEFIVVVPDTDTRQGGSMYSSSPTTGDFQAFVAKDLVAYIDSHYRTIAKRASRGLAGHSMGGYGVWTIGMKYPQVWSSLYAENACCISPRTETVEEAKRISEVPFEDSATADFGTRAALASAVAWSPNPKKPAYYADFAYKDGAIDPLVIAKWAANSPLAMVPQYIPALKSFTAIGVGVGDKDGLLADDTAIHDELDQFGIPNEFTVYQGGHADHIAEQFEVTVLPFFAKHLTMK